MAEPNDRADLDSVLHQIELLTARVTATADRHETDGDDVVASELYDSIGLHRLTRHLSYRRRS